MAVSDLFFVDATGVNYVDFPTLLAYYQSIPQTIYGNDIYLGDDSQDGQMVTAIAQACFDTFTACAADYNTRSPASAVGAGLSTIVKINGIEREGASNSTVELVIVGQYLTLLENAIAIDLLQQQWSIPTTEIPSEGTITVTATAVEEGAISAAPNTITGIFTPTAGWQSVNNPAAATVGAASETDAALRARQITSTSIAAQTVLEATVSAVENVPGVQEVVPYENATNATDANGLPPHSFSLVVSGGTDLAVAQTIQVKKTPGTQTYGTTSVPVTDSRGVPITINFFRPTNAEIGVQVTIIPGSTYLSSTAALIQAAIAAFIVAYPIGGTIVATQLYSVAYLPGNPLGSSFTISGILIKKNSGSFGSSNITLAFNEIPICNASSDVLVLT